MFKLLPIQKWHNLSDPGLEEALYDRSSFIFFSGFSLISSLPDHSTICRFRNHLLELNLYEKLLGEINKQLESNMQKSFSAIIYLLTGKMDFTGLLA